MFNLGVNDWGGGLPDENTWKTGYQYIIDACVVKWPSAKIYIVKPWNRGYTASATTMAGWIDALIAANPGVVFAGHNEAVWLEGGDNGVTMTADGTHYSAAGNTEAINQWMTVLGY